MSYTKYCEDANGICKDCPKQSVCPDVDREPETNSSWRDEEEFPNIQST